MPKIVTIEEVVQSFSYEATSEIQSLVSSYLDFATEELVSWLGTPLAANSYTDVFWYDDTSRARSLPYCQFNLTAGFVQNDLVVISAPSLEAFETSLPEPSMEVSQVNITLRNEIGTVLIHGNGLIPKSYYKMTYTAGFEEEPYIVNDICDSTLLLGTPSWLKQGAKILVSQLVRDHYSPGSRSKEVDRRLNDILHLKARRFGPSCRPL